MVDVLSFVSGQSLERILSQDQWIAEPALWTRWTHAGTFTARSYRTTTVVRLHGEELAQMVHKYRDAYQEVILYALHFLDYMNGHIDNEVSDMGMSAGNIEDFMILIRKRAKWLNEIAKDNVVDEDEKSL